MKDSGNDAFVCPNDRQLQLRAKLNSGWSFHTSRLQLNRVNNSALPNNNQSLRDDELERIQKVLQRAQRVEILEQQRISKLIDRLDNMKKNANGNGSTQCILCAGKFGVLGASSVSCFDCQKSVCNKCSIETVVNQQMISLCKICSENRELWKKSGAWFSRVLPTRSSLASNINISSSAISSVTTKNDDVSTFDESNSDDERCINNRFTRKSLSNKVPNNHFRNINPFQQSHETVCRMADHERDDSIDSFRIEERSSKELSIDEYLPKSQISQPSTSSMSSPSTSFKANAIPSPTIVHSSSLVNDSGFGTLDFEIIWKESLNVLTVTLLRAQNLQACDANNLSDPYVKLHLVPGVAKATKLRSRTIRRTLNPDFDETLVYHGITIDDMKTKSLKISLYDEDSVGSDFLGEYRLKLFTIEPDKKHVYSVYLQNKTDLPTDEDTNERGKLLISLMYSTATSNFHVKVIRGCQLLPMDFGVTSDPYCKLILLPLNNKENKWNFKTTVKKSTLQPEFNEEFVFQQVQLKELITKTLQITVHDRDVGKKDDYLGGFQLGQSESGDDLKHWFLMIKSPNVWIDMWHKLKPDEYVLPLRQ